MKPTTVARLLRLYPYRWRQRYGDEFAALLEAHPASVSAIADVVMGAIGAHAKALRESSGRDGLWDAFHHELRHAMRGIRRRPGFAAAVVITLGLGIGANSAMFGIIDRLLFRQPAYLRDADRVHRVYLARTVRGDEFQGPSMQYRRYLDLTRWTTSLDATAAFFYPSVAIGVGEDTREMRIGAVSASLFDFFDAKPIVGRFFTAQEDSIPAGSPVAVLSYAAWQLRYGGAPSAIGEKLHIGPVVYTIIGVAPKDFTGMTATSPLAFIPITSYAADLLGDRHNSEYYDSYSSTWMTMVARRKRGVTIQAATAEMSVAYRRSYAEQIAMAPRTAPIDVARPHVVLAPSLRERGPNQGNDSKVATWLVGVAAVVLLIACANVANLSLARAIRRRREISVRLALGVSRGRLIAQLLIESLLLATIGGLAGLALAQSGGRVLQTLLIPDAAPGAVAGDSRTLVFTSVTVLLVGILTGFVPAFHDRRTDLTSGLLSNSRSGTRERSTLRVSLLVLQVAMCVVLLVGAGLFVRTMLTVRSVHLGYDVDPILLVEPQMRNETPTTAELSSLKYRLLERAKSMSIVEAASLVTTVPYYQSSSGPVFVPGIDTATINQLGEFTRQYGSPDYFVTAGTRILRGRAFTAADRQGTPSVAVVTEAMAKALWPASDALGQCFKISADTVPCTTVIGVSENVRLGTLNGDASLHYYRPIEQRSPASGRLFIRIRGDAGKHLEEVRRELQRLMPGTSYVTVTPFANIIGAQTRSWRIGATMFSLFGLLALVLAAVGLYSVIAYDVAQRTHELGVRVALGAQATDVLRLIVGEGVRVGIAGVVVGGTIAFWAARWIKPLLFDGAARDPWVFGAVVVTLLSVSIVASLLPAARATRADPNTALRAE